ncbi:FMRFamide receptor-like [Lepeophtheirus salmonis]|uniref:FMRFamide receptor-like n=1 Tax=Lepeophtheirus salmonis TaxID=72036 RepID=UPI003AF397E0
MDTRTINETFSSELISDSLVSNKTLNTSLQYSISNEENTENSLFGTVVQGYALTFVSFWGFFGNLISIFILSQRQFTSPVCRLLITLSSYDTLYLLTSTLVFGLPQLSLWYYYNIYTVVAPMVYGFLHIGRVGSVFATLSITLERYFAVKWPLGEKRIQKGLISGTIIFSILFNIPKFYELRTEYVYNNETKTHDAYIQPSDLRNNIYYSTYYIFWSKFLLIEFIPYIILIVLNTSIMKTTHRAMVDRQRLGVQINQSQQLSKDEAQMSKILLTIVVVFVSCQSLKIIPDLYEVLTCLTKRGQCPSTPFIDGIIHLSHFFLAVNSSINFIIYIFRGSKFRKVFAQKFYRNKNSSSFEVRPSTVRTNIFDERVSNNPHSNPSSLHALSTQTFSSSKNGAKTPNNTTTSVYKNRSRNGKAYFTEVMRQTYV